MQGFGGIWWPGAGAMLALATGMALAQNPGANDQGANDAGQQQQTIQMVRARASLNTTLDAKKAKQGEPVKAKLQENVQIPNAEMLPKNTVLEGHVDQVQASENRGDSTLVVTFDKAVLKGVKELPIKATILQVSEPAMMQQDATSGAPTAGAPGGGTMSAGNNTGSGAGMGSAGPGAGGPGSGGPGSGGPGSGGPGTGASGPAAMDVPQANPNPQQERHQGGVPGVMLTSDIHDHASATFSSKGRNVHVPDGTEMQLALAVIPAGVKMQ